MVWEGGNEIERERGGGVWVGGGHYKSQVTVVGFYEVPVLVRCPTWPLVCMYGI